MSVEKAETQKARLPVIKINTRLCKGCEICVEFCPKRVLEMDRGKAVVKNLEACITCMLCEIRCPDFAITVEKGGNGEQKS